MTSTQQFQKLEMPSETYSDLPLEWRKPEDIPSIEEMIDEVRNDVMFADQFFLQESNDPRNFSDGTYAPIFDYQGSAMKTFDENDVVFFQASRGSAKSYTFARWAILYALRYPNQKIVLTAPSFRQSKQVFDYVIRILESNWGVDSHIYKLEQEVDKESIKRGHEVIVTFANGSYIEALPMGDGKLLRGRRATVVFCDEFYLFSEHMHRSHISHFLNVQVGERAAKIIYSTTAYYQECYAYQVLMEIAQFIRDGVPGYAIIDVTIDDVISSKRVPGLDDNVLLSFPAARKWILHQLKTAVDPVTGQLNEDALMQFYNVWIKSSSTFYKYDVVNASQRKECKVLTRAPEKCPFAFVLGVDPAAHGTDKCAMAILGLPGAEERHLNALYQWKNLKPDEIAGKIHELVDLYGIKLIVMDKSGSLGNIIADECCKPPDVSKTGKETGYKTMQIINGERKECTIITPWDHPDAAFARAQIVLTKPSDDMMGVGFYGDRYDQGMGSEIDLKNALHISMRAQFESRKFLTPAEMDDEAYNVANPLSTTDGEILDNIREALGQFPKIDRKRDNNNVIKTNERGAWYFLRPRHDDAAYSIVYANWAANIYYRKSPQRTNSDPGIVWDSPETLSVGTTNHMQEYRFF